MKKKSTAGAPDVELDLADTAIMVMPLVDDVHALNGRAHVRHVETDGPHNARPQCLHMRPLRVSLPATSAYTHVPPCPAAAAPVRRHHMYAPRQTAPDPW